MASDEIPTAGSVVVLATGGTIAGASARADDNVGYSAGQLAVEDLLAALPELRDTPVQAEQLAQLDSKDMSPAVWWRLSRRLHECLAQPQVCGAVVTHGTDTLEETAYWLHRTVRSAKPVVITAAMRPASSRQADGPQNLLDAVRLARHPGAQGVIVVMGGRVMAAHEVRKVHNYRVDAFSTGDSGALAFIEEQLVRQCRPWPAGMVSTFGDAFNFTQAEPRWPWVEIVTSHAGADGRLVDLLVEQGVQGLVVASTGNGSIHEDRLAALLRAQLRGVAVLRSTRCVLGHLVDDGGPVEGAGGLTPAQARVELMLRLIKA
jgi:L-asparaginase